MKYRFLSVLIFAFSFLSTAAQQSHFIYFQTENKQPFYIKLDNKIFTSFSSGYLILPKLPDGNYTIKFGSTKNEWAEQTINYKLNTDAGFVFKNFGEKGWGLFNLQSLDIIMAGNNIAQNNTPVQEVKDDDFSKMLANVVNDSTIKEKDIVIKEKDIVTKDEIKETPKESAALSVETTTSQAITQEVETPLLNSVIKRKLKKKNKDGMELVYTDEYNNKKDTIKIFIPVEETNEKNETKLTKAVVQQVNTPDTNKADTQPENIETSTKNNSAESAPLQTVSDESTTIEPKQDTTASLAIDTPDVSVNSSAEPIIKDTAQSETNETKTGQDKMEFLSPRSTKINPDCKGYATENDFLKLRKKMVAEDNEEDMIKVAKKVFKAKCFTTGYIKNLSTLFLKDEGKYNFFDAAYPYVCDAGAFSTLENQLSDAYYIKRFKAMIHQ